MKSEEIIKVEELNKEKSFKINDVILIILLILMNVLIGTPLKDNITIPNLLINIIAIIYLIISTRKKEKIKLNKIDICLIILSFSSIIPLIFNTYLRLSDTIEYILRYTSALNLYFIVKKYVNNDSKKIKIILNTIILMSILLVFFGIDMLTSNKLDKIYEFIEVPVLQTRYKERMISLFKYANTFCLYLSVAYMLSLGEFIKSSNNAKKAMYFCVMSIQIFAVIMTYSRLCLLFLGIVLILYIAIIKEKRKTLVKILLSTVVCGFIYYYIFNKLRGEGNILAIWIGLILQNIIQFILIFYADTIRDKFKKHFKIGIIVSITIVAMFSIYTVLNKRELVLYTNENFSKTYNRSNIAVEKNKKYILKADIEAKSKDKDNIKICVVQFDTEENQIAKDETIFDDYEGERTLEFETKENTTYIMISFRCIKPSKDTKLIVHSVKLNDREITVYYPLIPINFINRIEKLKINDASMNFRGEYIIQAINQIKNEPFSGYGGNAWKYLNASDSSTKSIAEHCYPLQLLLQNGAIAFISYVFLILSLCIIAYKKIKNNRNDIKNITLLLALALLFLHNILDFDMYFQIILLEMYMFIGFLNDKNSNKNEGKCILNYIYMGILFITLYLNLAKAINLNINTSKIENISERLKVVNFKIAIEPYNYSLYEDKARCLIILKTKGNALNNVDEQIIEATRFITDIEKDKNSEMYKRIIFYKIEMINEENKDRILAEIKEIWENEIGGNNKTIYDEIEKRLKNKLN